MRWVNFVWIGWTFCFASCGSEGTDPSNACIDDACHVASCSDRIQNQDEVMIDCGGSNCGACPGDSCVNPGDCASKVCTQTICQAATCEDDVHNGDETDVDCGGTLCPACVCTIQTDIPKLECDALYALYFATHGMSWANSANWLNTAPCTWAGVTCGGAPPSHVVSLDVSDNQLVGPIPPKLGNLTNLTSLSLGDNSLLGSIPPELGNLVDLTSLFLGVSQLTGSIPVELKNLTLLESLHLAETQLSGPIPAEFKALVNLTDLRLNDAKLTGTIPSELGDLTRLNILWLHNNQLSGIVPATLSNLNLRPNFLGLSGNLCLTAETPALEIFLNSRDPNWNDGCPSVGR